MRILVTGGCGFIGSNLVRYLLSKGHEVLNVDKLTYAGSEESLAGVSDHQGYRWCLAGLSGENPWLAGQSHKSVYLKAWHIRPFFMA